MELQFFKYQATGNDFVMVDDRGKLFPAEDQELVARLCHRRFGIGADGLILLQNHPGHDFEMVYFNADGKPGSMCGNGGRCIAAFAHKLIPGREVFRFLAYDGPHTAFILQGRNPDSPIVKLSMNDPGLPEKRDTDWIIDTGSPHYIRNIQNLDAADVVREGRSVRNSAEFADKGINVNFMEVSTPDSIRVRTYERGVEDETWSCGTGVTASALVARHSGLVTANRITVDTPGGKLVVSFQHNDSGFREVFLEGEASRVFEGIAEI